MVSSNGNVLEYAAEFHKRKEKAVVDLKQFKANKKRAIKKAIKKTQKESIGQKQIKNTVGEKYV